MHRRWPGYQRRGRTPVQRSGPEPGGRLHSGCCSGRGGREVPKGLTGTRGEVGQPEDPQGGHSKRCGCAPGVKLSWGGTPHQGGVVPGAMGPWQRVPCAPQPACLGSEGSRQGLHTGSRHQLFPLSIGTAPPGAPAPGLPARAHPVPTRVIQWREGSLGSWRRQRPSLLMAYRGSPRPVPGSNSLEKSPARSSCLGEARPRQARQHAARAQNPEPSRGVRHGAQRPA